VVREFLRAQGWPDPVLADSGNGFHLLNQIDLPADDGGLVQRVLAAIATRLDTELVKIDRAVHNPARLCKLPFTWARKGDPTGNRPHRQARLLEVPPGGPIRDLIVATIGCRAVQPVPIERLHAIVANAPADPRTQDVPAPPPAAREPTRNGHTGQHIRRLLVSRWQADRGVGFREKPEPDGKGLTVFVLGHLPVRRGPRPGRGQPCRPRTDSSGPTAFTTDAPAEGGRTSRRRSAIQIPTTSTLLARAGIQGSRP
jgi:hypothetical protein